VHNSWVNTEDLHTDELITEYKAHLPKSIKVGAVQPATTTTHSSPAITTRSLQPAHCFHSEASPCPSPSPSPEPYSYLEKPLEGKVDHFSCLHHSPSPFELPHKAPFPSMSYNNETGHLYFKSDANTE